MSRHSSPFTAALLQRSLATLSPANTYYVGFSGGADSSALLQALFELRGQLSTPVKAVHINHGLNVNSAQWQLHCEAFCRQRQISLTCLQIELQHTTGKGIEAEARHLRYQAIEALLGPGDSLLTAHHANDQAETVLLNLMRGSGVDGLSAMPAERPFGAGKLQRPLLGFDPDALQAYLRGLHIKWLQDPSNQVLAHDRNFIRHQVMPLLEQRWPGATRRLLLTRRVMAETRPVLESLAGDLLQECLVHPLVLELQRLPGGEPGHFKLAIRHWLKQSAVASIPVHQLESLLRQATGSNAASRARIAWGGCTLHLYKGCLWLQTGKPLKSCMKVAWQPGSNSVDLGEDSGRLELATARPANDRTGFISCSRNCSHARTLLRNGHHQSLKKLFQAAAIPPWLRDSIPLTRRDGELVAVGDWYLSDRFKDWLSDHRAEMVWQPHHPLLRYLRDRQHVRGQCNGLTPHR